MKTTFFSILLIIISSCSKNDNSSTNPTPTSQDQLPPATQIGANKVGCLVNGQVFLPYQKNPFGAPAVVCFYQYINSFNTFSLGISNNRITNGFQNINIASKNINLQQGNSYQIKLDEGNNLYASYFTFGTIDYFTNNTVIGELIITRLDQTNAIMSGTFWFDAINSSGAKVEVREGRFDMQYSQ